MNGPRTIFVNARFLAEPITGTQRYGREILLQLDAMLEEGLIDRDAWRFVLLTPLAPPEDVRYRHLRVHVAGPLRSHLWEQFILPLRARGFLLNLKNTAPVRHRKMAVVIHDLQVYVRPQTYTRTFVRLYRFIFPRVAHRARLLIADARNTAADIEKWLGVPAARVLVAGAGHEHVLRSPAELAILERHRLEPGSYLLGVSSLNPNKNFAGLLRALRLAELDGHPVVIAGGTDPRVFGDHGLQELPCGTRYVGRVSDAELRALYENALAFVYPSFYEGFGLPPLEAMALGCPVVVSRSSSLPEVCGEAALYCDPASDADIARQIVRVASDPALRRELTAKGRLQAQRFRWRDTAATLWRAIEPIAGAD